jgi:hypothetical protein
MAGRRSHTAPTAARGRLRERRTIRSSRASLHIGKLKAQSGNPPPGQPVRHGCHERVRHAGTCPVRQDKARNWVWWRLEQSGDAVCRIDTDLHRTSDAQWATPQARATADGARPDRSAAKLRPLTVKIAPFNINDVNRRLPNLLEWLAEAQPDVACLQEYDLEHRAPNSLARSGLLLRC